MSSLFHDLFIFEMANNHQGSVEHGRRIIDALGEIVQRRKIRAAIKFQFRDLETFIHPDFRAKTDIKHIPRFLSTALSKEDFAAMIALTKKRGLLAMSTPFDEQSVAQCMEQNIDVIKVASCSAMDWPLLEEIAATGKPVIVSTGGLHLADIDKVVSFLRHKGVTFALMHCVGMYPTPPELLQLGIIARLRKRYPDIAIGYSGHESPSDVLPAAIAVGNGASFLERHVGMEAKDIPLNAYSMNPQQTDAWVQTVLAARDITGDREKKTVTKEEADSLRSLMRGTYARIAIKKGKKIGRRDVYFAMPLQEEQLSSGEFGSYRAEFTASRDYAADEPLREAMPSDSVLHMREVIHEAKGMLSEAGISVGGDCSIELSHHYGMERFREIGATIINIINREYCKKLIIVLPGQKHPLHQHERKEETFEMLFGDLEVTLDGETIQMKPGNRLLIKRNSLHGFTTKQGAIFEEISTTHYRDDSLYQDQTITVLDPVQRKTIIDNSF